MPEREQTLMSENNAIVVPTFSALPIGWVRAPYVRRFGTPQQASAIDSDARAVLELDAERIPLRALCDLEGMERIWVLA
jgi:tRNA (Thr-GGU) A37 N-methylase